ncbi:serine/threonine-protein kinase [Lentzea sp. NPDC051838]|uniref:serine/threonine-protein kinase n=1 Tax=Lentzea sp. NPDC051838 TaxID=3154849 RepID=UPI0034490AC0
MGWQPGDRLLDLYDVLDVVRSGGMGLVYRVRHRTWQVDLAIKTPRAEWVATHADRERFEDEAGTWVGLGLHPNVVGCAYVRRIDEVPCVFAEWVDGGSLATAVSRGDLYGADTQDSTARILDISIQTAWGIGHAHDQGIVHRDVKPANVMLDGDISKITDFGLATASHAFRTREYSSPEQAAAAAGAQVQLTNATDVWSWALSVLEMFVGRTPCRYGQAAPFALEALLADGPWNPRAPRIPQNVAELLRQCFQEDPQARPADLGEAAEALVTHYAEVTGSAYPRNRPKAASLLADSLSNQALSLVDLGRTDEAEELWRQAVNVDPHHLPAVYNWGLYRWRLGRMTDVEVVSELDRVRELTNGDQSVDHLLGLVELERGNDEAAERLLQDAPGSPDFDAARVVLAERSRTPQPALINGFGAAATCTALSEDGSVAVLGTADGRAVVWSPTDLVVLRETHGEGKVTIIAISADGSRFLVARTGGAVELHDAATRLCALPDDEVTAVALDRTGRTGATVHRGGAVRVWDFDTGTCRLELTAEPPAVAVALDGRGTRVVTVCGDGSDHHVFTWDAVTGRPGPRLSRTKEGYLTGIDEAKLTADGSHVLLYRRHGKLGVWDTRTGETRSEAPNLITAYSRIAVSGDGSVAVSVAELSSLPLRVWDTASGRCVRSIDVKLGVIFTRLDDIAISADGRIALVLEGQVQVHHLPARGYLAPWHYVRPAEAGELDARERQFHGLVARAGTLLDDGSPARAAAVLRQARGVPGFDRHPDLRTLWAQAGRHGTRTAPLGVWSRWSMQGTWIFTPRVSLEVTADGEWLVTGGTDGRTRVWDVATGECLGEFPDQTPGHVHTISMSRDDRSVVTADYGGGAFLWDLADGRTLPMFGDESRVRSLHTNGEQVAIGHESGAVCVWDIDNRATHRRTILAHDQVVEAVAVSPDGHTVASRNHSEQAIRVWDATTGRRRFQLPSSIWTGLLRFSREGDLLFATELDGFVAWNVNTGDLAYKIPERGGTDVFALSADGRTAAGTGRFDQLMIWDAATGQVRCRLPVRAEAVALTTDGRYAAVAQNVSVQIWDLRTQSRTHVLEGHVVDVMSVRFAAEDRLLLSTDLTPVLRLWELEWDYEFEAGA